MTVLAYPPGLTKPQRRLYRLIHEGKIKYLHNLEGGEWVSWRILLQEGHVKREDDNKLSITSIKPNP